MRLVRVILENGPLWAGGDRSMSGEDRNLMAALMLLQLLGASRGLGNISQPLAFS